MRTLLWLYADLVVHKNMPHSPDVFKKACLAYSQLRGVPPISVFAVAEDHFISGPGKGLAGLDSGMAAPMGISSRVPPETRVRLRHINAAQRAQNGMLERPAQAMPGYDEDAAMMGEYDEGEEEGDMMGGDPMQNFAMFAGMESLHPDLAGAWLNHPSSMLNAAMGASPGIHPGFASLLQRQAMMMQTGLPNELLMSQMLAAPYPNGHHQQMPSMPGGGPGGRQANRRPWPAPPNDAQHGGGRYEQGEGGMQEQGWMQHEEYDDGEDGEEPSDPQQQQQQQHGGGGRERRLPQRFREEEEEEQATGGAAFRPKAPPARPPQSSAPANDDAASMLLALADAANSILDEGDPNSSGGPSRKRPYAPTAEAQAEQQRRQRSSSGGGNPGAFSGGRQMTLPGVPGYAGLLYPPPTQQQPLSRNATPQQPGDVEKRALARLAHEAAASLTDSKQQQDQLWRQLENKMSAGAGPTGGGGAVGVGAPLGVAGVEVEQLEGPRRGRATNSSSLATEEPLGPVTGGCMRVSGSGAAQEEGGAVTVATAASPSSTRDKDLSGSALPLQRAMPSASTPGAGGSGMEDSVVETLGKLATDPSLSAQERVHLISSYMKAVQQFVKVTVE